MAHKTTSIERDGTKIAFNRPLDITVANCNGRFTVEYVPLGIRIEADRPDTAIRYFKNELFACWRKYCTVPERALNQRGVAKRNHFRQIVSATTYCG